MKKSGRVIVMSKYDYNILLAIDIGLRGAISVFDTVSSELLSIQEMPVMETSNSVGKTKNVVDIDKLLHIMEIPKEKKDSAIVVYEGVHAFPGQGVVAVGTLLEQKGIIRGLAKGLGYSELAISPKTWQKYFDIIPPKDLKGTTGAKTKVLRKKWLKANSLDKARERFPDWINKITHDGVSDSILLGLWYLETPAK
jgi:hypothetical protein